MPFGPPARGSVGAKLTAAPAGTFGKKIEDSVASTDISLGRNHGLGAGVSVLAAASCAISEHSAGISSGASCRSLWILRIAACEVIRLLPSQSSGRRSPPFLNIPEQQSVVME
jgi:hypothetical protein